jgi:hypothetical protein
VQKVHHDKKNKITFLKKGDKFGYIGIGVFPENLEKCMEN